VYSVDTEEEAEQLLVASCPRNYDGEFVAPQLVEEQTLENLEAFSDHLAEVHQRMNHKTEKKMKPEIGFVECLECGHEQADMGSNVACEECGYGPMPYAKQGRLLEGWYYNIPSRPSRRMVHYFTTKELSSLCGGIHRTKRSKKMDSPEEHRMCSHCIRILAKEAP